MKAILRSISMLIVFTLVAATLSAAQSRAILSEIKGKVQVKALNGAWTDATNGMTLDILATVSTGFDSTVKIVIDKNTLFVKPLTRMTIDKLVEEAGKVSTNCFLRVGSVSVDIKSAEGVRQDFKVMSPYSTASVRGTRFDYDGKKLKVWEGTVLFLPGRPNRDILLADLGLADGEEPNLDDDFIGAPESGQDPAKGVLVNGGGRADSDDLIPRGPGSGGGGGSKPDKPAPVHGGVYIELEVED